LKACQRWRRKKRRFQDHYVGYQEVRLPGRDPGAPGLWLVVSIVPGRDGGVMMLLTNLPITRFRQAERVLRYYRRRWKAEDGIRLVKQRVGLEGFRIRSLRAIRRLCFLALLAIAFLVTLSLKTLSLAERIAKCGQPLRRATGMILYRLARGMQNLLTRPSRHDLCFLRKFQNG